MYLCQKLVFGRSKNSSSLFSSNAYSWAGKAPLLDQVALEIWVSRGGASIAQRHISIVLMLVRHRALGYNYRLEHN